MTNYRGGVSTDGEEMDSVLEERWLKYDDSSSNGTEIVDEKRRKEVSKKRRVSLHGNNIVG